jgi:6-phosphofructokinase 1
VERSKGNLVIANGGGPTAVINASVVGVVLEAFSQLPESSGVWGARQGISGLLDEVFVDLRRQPAGTWDALRQAPASALGSCRKKLDPADLDRALEVCRKHEIRYFLYVGGNDSMDTANRLAAAARDAGYELFVAGVPKTVDNDLADTDFCPGYGSCARFYAQAVIDLGADVRSLPTPVSIFETMGRNAGWLVASTVLARGSSGDAPHLVYVPEVPLSTERFLADVEAVHAEHGWVVAAVSEGVRDERGEPLSDAIGEAAIDGFGHRLPGDVAPALARLVTRELGLRARSEKPGLIARASSHHVSSADRAAAEGVGQFAARHVLAGNSRFMAAIRRLHDEPLELDYRAVPLEATANLERLLPASYIAPDGNHIDPAFDSYARPLIGGALRSYGRLDPSPPDGLSQCPDPT